VLSELLDDHPAVVAYSTGAVSDSIGLTHLLKERPDLVDRLVAAYLGHNARIWARCRGGAHFASASNDPQALPKVR
jgi:hypothetical protein